MKTKTLRSIIRKQYYPRLIFPFILFLSSIAVAIINPFENGFKAVNVTNPSQVDSLFSGSSKYVHMTVDELNYTGLDYTISGKVRARIYYSISDDQCYYFIIDTKSLPKDYYVLTNYTMNARLIHNNNMYRSVNASMSESLHFSLHDLNKISSQTFISQYDYVHSFTTFYMIVSHIIGFAAIIMIIFIIVVLISPNMSVGALKLRKYGNRSTLFALAEAEFDTAVATGRKNVYITDNFLITYTKTVVEIVPINKIAWIYRYSEIHHTKKKTHVNTPLCIVTDTRRLIKIHHVSENAAEKIINGLQEKHPEILVGYNE